MQTIRYLMVALSVAVPATALAQAAPQQPEQQQAAPQQPAPQQAAPQQPAPSMQVAPKQLAEIKGNILPIQAGIESTRASAYVLRSLAMTEPFERKDARKTAEIANQAAKVAHQSAEDLSKMKGLSAEAQAQAQLAAGKLKEVRSTIDQIEGQIGIIEGAFVKNDAENVRNLAARLLEELDSAQRATQNVANIYQVSTKLDAQK
ncbi:MAG TPA: hypothetical protein PKA58_12660 [Polyangium sp.]|nr:hypothetical protein [Polyangium sp.]